MPRLSVEARRRVIALHQQGWKAQRIWEQLKREGITPATLRAIYYLLSKSRLDPSISGANLFMSCQEGREQRLSKYKSCQSVHDLPRRKRKDYQR